MAKEDVSSPLFKASSKTSYDVNSIMTYTSMDRSKPWFVTKSGKQVWPTPDARITPRDAQAVRSLYLN